MSKKIDSSSEMDAQDTKKQESKYNPSVLRECIMSGMPGSEIMVKLGVKHRQTLKQYVLKLMSDDKTYYEVKDLYLKNSRRPKVNAKLELKLYLKNLDLSGVSVVEGDEFSLSVQDGKIILEKA